MASCLAVSAGKLAQPSCLLDSEAHKHLQLDEGGPAQQSAPACKTCSLLVLNCIHRHHAESNPGYCSWMNMASCFAVSPASCKLAAEPGLKDLLGYCVTRL